MQSEHSYKIIVSHNGKYHYKTWRIPEGLSASKALRELEQVAIEFRDSVKSDQPPAETITFEEYSWHFLQVKRELKKVKDTTYSDYLYLLSKINPRIGHYNIEDITSRVLNDFFMEFTDAEAKETITVTGRDSLREAIKDTGYTISTLAELAKISSNTISVAINGGNIMYDKALLISESLQRDIDDIFIIKRSTSAYASKTISSIVKLTGSILDMACKEGVLKENPIKKAQTPKYIRSIPNYLTDEQVILILEASEKVEIKKRLLIELYVMTGARRGEIVGLTWDSVDFDSNTIYIGKEVIYTPHSGIQIVTPKTESGIRAIELPASTMSLLYSYREWYVNSLRLDSEKVSEGEYLFFQPTKLPDITPMNPTDVTGYFNKFSKKYGLPHLNPHALRHAYASVLIASGKLNDLELAQALGHSSAQITREIYGHLLHNPAAKTASIVSEFYKVDKRE